MVIPSVLIFIIHPFKHEEKRKYKVHNPLYSFALVANFAVKNAFGI